MKQLLPVIVIFAAIGPGGASHAASWNFEVVETPPFYDPGHRYESSLAVASGGMPRIAYSNTERPAGGQLLTYAAKDQAGWHTECVDKKHDAAYPSLVLDSSGPPHISYSRTNGLYYARSDGGAWNLPPAAGPAAANAVFIPAMDSAGEF